MPLVPPDARIPDATVREIFDQFATELGELGELIDRPRSAVRDPASLRTARELLDSAREIVSGPPPPDRAELVRRANLAYAVTLAVIDLVKSHTEGPTVPRSSKTTAP